MTKFTKEQLIDWAMTHKKRAIEYAAIMPNDEYAQKDLALYEAALTALTAPSEPVYQYRIRNRYNGQVTEWQTIRRDQVDFVLKAQPHNAEFQIIAPPAPVVPDGYVLVPVEPTDEMLSAAMCSDDVSFDKDDATMFRVHHGVIWRAMLAAVPQQEAK